MRTGSKKTFISFYLNAECIEQYLKGKVLPYSLPSVGCTGSQPAGDYKLSLGGRLPLLTARLAVTVVSVHQMAPPLTEVTDIQLQLTTHVKDKKAEHLYSALHAIQTTLKRSDMDHTAFNLQRTPCHPLPRKRSPDGAFTEFGGGHLIAAHYSFINPERMKGWVVLVGWPIADGLPT